MDDEVRTELAALRLRAYGPDADITGDRRALDRLIELEAIVLHDHPEMAQSAEALVAVTVHRGVAPDSRGFGFTDERGIPPTASDIPTAPEADESGLDGVRRRRAEARSPRRTVVVAIAAVFAVAVAISVANTLGRDEPAERAVTSVRAAEVYSFARDPSTRALLQIPLDGSFGNYIDLPSGNAPRMPSSGPVQWAAPLGEYYGWELWIAGASGVLQEKHRLLVRRGGETEGRCVPATLRSQSALVVDLGYADIADDERPAGMTEDHRIGFWWLRDTAVSVLIGAKLTEP